MGIFTNLEAIISSEMAALALIVVMIFGVRAFFDKEKGKMIGAIVGLFVCLVFIVKPSVIIQVATALMDKIFAGAGGGGI